MENENLLVKISDDFYLLDYKGDYALDKFMQTGTKGVTKLFRFVQKQFKLKPSPVLVSRKHPACTSFSVKNDKGERIFGRNFDYYDSPCILLRTTPKNGYKSLAMLDVQAVVYLLKFQKPEKTKNPSKLLASPYMCMDGMNEKGLCIAILEIETKPTYQETGKIPMVPPTMVRAVLDKCATVDEAVEMFRKFDMYDLLGCNYHYHICDANGKSVVIEYINGEMLLVEPKDDTQYCMNFFFSMGGDNSTAIGFDREVIVRDAIKEKGGVFTTDEAMNLLSKCTLNFREHIMMIYTLWSALYNSTKKTVNLCIKRNFETRYEISFDTDFEEYKNSLPGDKNG